MLEIQAKAEYADVMELALYNGVLSGMALDGKSFFYVNPLEADPEASKGNPTSITFSPAVPDGLTAPAARPTWVV